MNPSETQKHSQEYLERCRHPEIQALQPKVENTEGMWIPTSEQLQQLLKQKLPTSRQIGFPTDRERLGI